MIQKGGNMNLDNIIEVKNLTKIYDKIPRVNNLNLNVKKGEIYGFLGPNGAGKTTTMKMLLDLVKPTKGEIRIFNKDLEKEKVNILRETGSIIENPSYYGHLTGAENIEIVEKLLDLPKGIGDRALKLVSLEKDKNKKVKDYSLGMKQRLGIAMALVRSPQLLILDEPTNGLDPAGTKEIRELIKKLAHEYGITVMISSHLLSEIEKVADRIGIIQNGSLIFEGDFEELDELKNPELIIETSDNYKALEILRTYEPKIEEKKVVISNINKENRTQLVKKLLEANLDLYLMYERTKSLEDIFLNLTERDKQ